MTNCPVCEDIYADARAAADAGDAQKTHTLEVILAGHMNITCPNRFSANRLWPGKSVVVQAGIVWILQEEKR